MKKKLIAVCLIIAMMAITVVGGTMAYFFDTATATNTFTVGNVSIDLIEKGEDNTTDFVQDQPLTPGASDDEHAVAKRVWVTNTGANEAWVWVEVLIPAQLDVKEDASKNSLHFNYYGQFIKEHYKPNWDGSYSETPVDDGILDANHKPTVNGMIAVEDGLWILDSDVETLEKVYDKNGDLIVDEAGNAVPYNCYVFKMDKTLASGATSLPVLRQVYMDSGVMQCTDETHVDCLVLKDKETHYTGDWELIVRAYAMQNEGFEYVDDAIAAYAEAQK